MAVSPTYVGEASAIVIGTLGSTTTWQSQLWKQPKINGAQVGDRLFMVVGFLKTTPAVTIVPAEGWSLYLNMDAVRVYTKIATSYDLDPDRYAASAKQSDNQKVVWAYYNPGRGGVQTFLGSFFWMTVYRNGNVLDGASGQKFLPANLSSASGHVLPSVRSRYPANSVQFGFEVAYRFGDSGAYGSTSISDFVTRAKDTPVAVRVWAALLADRSLAASGRVNSAGMTRAEATAGWQGWHIPLDSYYIGSIVMVGSTPPSTPQLNTPTSGARVDLANYANTFKWQYFAEDGSKQSAWAFRLNAGAGQYLWWNATTLAFQPTEVFNSGTAAQATIPAGVFNNGQQQYLWSVAVRSSNGMTSGYASPQLVIGDTKPLVTILAPSAVVDDTTSPTIRWMATDPDAQLQQQYELSVVETAAPGVTFDAFGPTTVWYYSGIVNGADLQLTLPVALKNGQAYTVFLRVNNGQWSDWESVGFTLQLDAPDSPRVRVIPE